MVRLLIGIVLGTLLVPANSWGLKDYKRSMPKKINSYLSDGVVIGGVAGRGFSSGMCDENMGPKPRWRESFWTWEMRTAAP